MIIKRRSTRSRIVIVAAALTAALAVTGVASAHDGTDPSYHATTTSCRETTADGKWTVVSTPYMTRTDGFDARGVVYTGGGNVLYGGTGSSAGYSDQWLYYRVVVGTQDRYGQWTWQNGTWMRRANQLGGATDGISTEVETEPNSGVFVRTNYALAGGREDASYASGWIGVGSRTKVIWGQMWYGPIYSGNTLVWASRYHWVPIGYVNCG